MELAEKRPISHQPWLPLRFMIGVALALGGALALFVLLMRPPAREFRLMAIFLTLTALLSVAVGYGAYRTGWLRFAPSIGSALMATYALSSLITFLNVWVTARLMFASQHDLILATILLLYASGIAISLGYFLSAALRGQIGELKRAAGAVARGEPGVRAPEQGRDELAELARAFNEMAARLDESEQRQRELEQMRRDLIAWVGHDLRTPLASVRAVVEALADGVVNKPATERRYLKTAQRDIRALSLLIDDLFEMAQLDAGGVPSQWDWASLSDLLSDTIESFTALAAQRGVALGGEAEPDVDPVRMDSRQIGRALSNIVSNALRHTPAGGQVFVRASRRGEIVRITVSDTGDGIATGDLPHIFDQFYRGEKSRNREWGGAGLGLAIARRLVEAHGGSIGVTSVVGEGTVVTIALPRATRQG